MAKIHRDRSIRHRNATPVAEFPFVNVNDAGNPVNVTLTKANVTVIEIGKPWLVSATCYGLRMIAKIRTFAAAPDLNKQSGDSIFQTMIAELSHDFAEACGLKSKMLPTLAVKETDNGTEQIYTILLAMPVFPSSNEIERIIGRLSPVQTIIGHTNFYQDLQFLYARADFLEERAESS
jgi:hypothetical protein